MGAGESKAKKLLKKVLSPSLKKVLDVAGKLVTGELSADEVMEKMAPTEEEQDNLSRDLQDVFTTYDVNKNGVLEKEEALVFVRDCMVLGCEFGVEFQLNLLSQMGVDSSELPKKDELMKLALKEIDGKEEEFFQLYDTNHDGVLSWEEFTANATAIAAQPAGKLQ